MDRKLSRREKWAYGSADVSFSLVTTIVGAYFAIFLTDVAGVPAAVAAQGCPMGGVRFFRTAPIGSIAG